MKRLVWLVVAVMLAAACGTRVSDARIIAANGTSTAGASARQPAVASTASGAAGSEATTIPIGSGGAAQGVGAGPAATTAVGAGGQAGGSGAAAASAPSCASKLDPVRIGQTGIFSGFLAPATAGIRTGLSVWAAEVNARGGVQCHPVELNQLDDASDPARASSNVRELIDDRKVAALVGVTATITMPAVRSVVDPRGFPVIGGDLLAEDWFQDSNLYPQGGTGYAGFVGPVQANAQAGHSRFGLLYCVEVSICTGIHDRAAQIAAAAGAQLVFDQSTSLTQTDYTAECQNAKQSGVDSLFVAADGSALARVARSCAALDFRPQFATVGIAVTPALGDDPNVRAATVTVGAQNPPFVANDVPGMVAFQSAMATYAPGEPLTQAALEGYASGRLFEAAMAKVADAAAAGPITTDMVKQGLGRIAGDTLDGLAPPLTFTAGQPAPVSNCYFVLQVGANGFAAPQGSRPSCL